MRWEIPGLGVCAMGVSLLAAPTASAATVAVAAGGDFQAALNAAKAGDVITLAAGAVYTGNFVLPNKGTLSDYITIRTSAPDGSLPPAGVRITPASAALLPKIKSPNSMSSLQTAAGANHYKLMFLEFQANLNGYGDIMAIGAGDSSQTQLSQVPYAFVIDRVYVHGDPVLGQKRGIALHSSDTTIVNSWVSDCKAVGQDTQAIAGFNGPGNYVIENNYLEAATENFLLGGADPMIPNLVTTNVTFRRNYLSKPLAWRNPIIATPVGVAATAAIGAGSLAEGTYSYKVVARTPAGQTNQATSSASVEVSAVIPAGAAGGVTVTWTPVVGAADYLVYGRTPGGENMYWKTKTPYFTDSGVAGTSGTSGSATKWQVKNLFELKNAQDVLVEGNVFENLWVAAQPGYPIVFTPRNQSGTAPWVIVQRVTFQRNLVRHTAGGVNILGVDNLAPSQRTNHITIRDNIFDDLTASAWGSSRPFQIGDGPDAVTIDHNTVITTDSAVVWLYGGSATAPTAITNTAITNNMSSHNSYGIDGGNFSPGMTSINAYLAGGVVTGNLLAGGTASRYPAGNFFPTVATWQSNFVNYGGGDYHLSPASTYKNAGTDGADLGANVDLVNSYATGAVAGYASAPVSPSHVRIITTSLPNAMFNTPYAQAIACDGVPACAWQLIDNALPGGTSFNPSTAVVAGTPTVVATGSVTIEAYDPAFPGNNATTTLTLTVDAPPFVLTVPPSAAAQVGAPFLLTPSVSGALGSTSWSIIGGQLPGGLSLDPASGAISGVPTTWGSTTPTVQVQDSWRPDRLDAKSVTISVAPARLTIGTNGLPAGSYQTYYSALLNATGGTGAITWSLTGGTLPPGLIFNPTGTISGVPSSVGTFGFSVQAQDVNWPSNIAGATLSLTVVPPASVVIATTTVPDATVNRSYQASLVATGGTGSTAWSLAGGILPPGLAMTANGVISGTPTTAGTFTATVRATDAGWSANVAQQQLTLSVRSREVVIYAADSPKLAGTWSRVADVSAAGGARVWNPNANAAKLTTALASPTNYFEVTFQAEAGVPYHLWLRGKADSNYWGNDSVFAQFSSSVDAGGNAMYRIGTTGAAEVNLEDCSGCGESGWGWQDNGYGVNVLGPSIYFATSGLQTLRLQIREDGFSIDQIVFSAGKYLTASPGALKNDTTIVPR